MYPGRVDCPFLCHVRSFPSQLLYFMKAPAKILASILNAVRLVRAPHEYLARVRIEGVDFLWEDRPDRDLFGCHRDTIFTFV